MVRCEGARFLSGGGFAREGCTCRSRGGVRGGGGEGGCLGVALLVGYHGCVVKDSHDWRWMLLCHLPAYCTRQETAAIRFGRRDVFIKFRLPYLHTCYLSNLLHLHLRTCSLIIYTPLLPPYFRTDFTNCIFKAQTNTWGIECFSLPHIANHNAE